MALAELFSLSYPDDSMKQKLFHAKVFRFFSYSISNMLSLIYGSFLISLVLYVQGTEVSYIIIYFSTTTIISLSAFFISIYVEKVKPEKHKLQNILVARIFLGCCIGFMYGFASFMLPADAIETGVLFLIIIYLISISVAIFQYSVIPTYYILFMFSVFIPVFMCVYLSQAYHYWLIYLFIISAAVIFISKGIKISANEVSSIFLNIELNKEAEEHLETRNKLHLMAMYDGLTKVASRYHFNERSEYLLDRAKNNNYSLTIIYIDLNYFKEINDRFGHTVGDSVLFKAAEILRSKVRSSDLVARLGGDEFVIILKGLDNAGLKASLLKDICNSLNREIDIKGNKINLSASIGIASYPEDGNTIEEILHAADTHMYKNKQGSREANDSDSGDE